MDGISWSCPGCRGELEPGEGRWSCRGCGAGYRAVRGIPDLRTGDDLYMPNGDDWAIARELDAGFDRLDFRGLLDLYFDLAPGITPESKRRQLTHILTAPGRARGWVEGLGSVGRGTVLDLGCGSGSFLAAAGREFAAAGGVDIAMRWLLVARKRLDEAGLGHIPLACACAENLPLRGACVAGVVAGDVFEHVADQGATLAEAHRVLRAGGTLFLASPNRYSLAPEPHVGVWGVGFLPRRWMPAYVRMASGADFRAIRTLGYAEWVRTLSVSPFGGGRVTAPPLPGDDLAHFGPARRAMARVYNEVAATAAGRLAARSVGPLFHVVCEKRPATPTPTPTRATRRRSTPSATPG